MVVAVRVKQRPFTSFEQGLLTRGIPTNRMVQDRIAEDMRRWLEPRLEKLRNDVMAVLREDIARGRITPPPIGQKGASSELQGDEWWEKATSGWEDDAEDWLRASLGRAAEYQARRFNFHVDMRLMNRAAYVYSENTWWPDLIKLDGDKSVVAETRNKVWSSVRRWQEGELGDRGLPDLAEHLAKWFDPVRANRIAVTEATRVYAEGSRAAWLSGADPRDTDVAFGIVAMRWQTCQDEIVMECPICWPLNGRQILLNQSFPGFEGDVPPAHVSCRCWITPIKDYNPKRHPRGRRPAAQSTIDRMRKLTMPERIQAMLAVAARGTVPSASLDDLVDNLVGVRGWTPAWRKGYRKSFTGASEEVRKFIARQHQYSGAIELSEIPSGARCHFQPMPGDTGYILMARDYRAATAYKGFVLRHELGHSYDWQLGGMRNFVSSSPRWKRAISKYTTLAKGEGIPADVRTTNAPMEKYSMNSAVQDIYSALGVKGAYGHSADYWAQGDWTYGTQIFANLFSLRCRKKLGIYNAMKKALPDIVVAFEEAMEL